MLRRMLSLCGVAVFFMAVTAQSQTKPPYIDCISSQECLKNQCCVKGAALFSLPYCKPMLEIGEPCLAALRPISENVTYPDNAFVMYEDIYHNHCPCGIGLSCDTKSATCVDPSSHNDFNDLDYY